MMRNESDVILTKTGGSTFYVYTHARPDGSVFYVGKGVGDRARDWWRRSDHHKRIVAKHGRENILITAHKVHDETHAYAVERQLILAMRKAGVRLCNVDDGGHGRIGVRIGDEQRSKIRASLMGHPVSDETRKKIGEAGRGRKATAATREKLSRKKLSDEHKAALLRAITGRAVPEAQKEKARAKMAGRKLTEEHRRKLSESHKGLKHDPSTKEARSAALRAAWAKRKAEGARVG